MKPQRIITQLCNSPPRLYRAFSQLFGFYSPRLYCLGSLSPLLLAIGFSCSCSQHKSSENPTAGYLSSTTNMDIADRGAFRFKRWIVPSGICVEEQTTPNLKGGKYLTSICHMAANTSPNEWYCFSVSPGCINKPSFVNKFTISTDNVSVQLVFRFLWVAKMPI